MKEFIEKLIERLEEKRNKQIKPHWGTTMVNAGIMAGLDIAIEIVNQLAEEYNSSKSSGLSEQIANDLSTVLKEAKDMGCTEVRAFHHIPLENVEIVINALRAFNQKNQDLDKLRQEPKTRIERIRSMSVEEMADTILERSEISTAIDFCQNFCGECENIPESESRKCLIQWLNSPVEQKKAIPTEHFNERFNTVV